MERWVQGRMVKRWKGFSAEEEWGVLAEEERVGCCWRNRSCGVFSWSAFVDCGLSYGQYDVRGLCLWEWIIIWFLSCTVMPFDTREGLSLEEKS
jgi:hypothetical protein